MTAFYLYEVVCMLLPGGRQKHIIIFYNTTKRVPLFLSLKKVKPPKSKCVFSRRRILDPKKVSFLVEIFINYCNLI
jgi:hypothetical protein